jgi:hypothetical protein
VSGNLAITLSLVGPAASVFAISPVALGQQGSGAFLAFLLAALLSGCVAVGWAELGALYPTAGAATPTGSCWTHPSVTETSATTKPAQRKHGTTAARRAVTVTADSPGRIVTAARRQTSATHSRILRP